MASLEASFTAFNAMAKHFAKSIEHGQSSALQASASLLAMKDEVQVSVRDWASGVSEKSTRMVEDLLEHQQEHLSMVSVLQCPRLMSRWARYSIRRPIWWTR